MKYLKLILVTILVIVFAAQCAPAATTPTPAAESELPLFYGAFATPIEEPWDGVIHAALQQAAADGKIRYEFTDDIGYAGDMERVLREIAENQKPAAILGDAFGNEEAVRRVAVEYPEIAFAFGSGLGPAEPNMAVFDNWIHERGYPVPEVNRIVNAFIDGAKSVNPEAKVIVTFINSWFDPAAAKEAALAQVDAGADVLFAERFGVIDAAAEKGLLAFGNMSDQNSLAPETVITGPVWNMTPTVESLVAQVNAGSFTAIDLKDFSMVAKGGASLADFHGMDAKIPAEVLAKVKETEQQIKDGLFRVDIKEEPPVSD